MLDAKHDMNKLPLPKRVQILSMLVEGSSMRSISRVGHGMDRRAGRAAAPKPRPARTLQEASDRPVRRALKAHKEGIHLSLQFGMAVS
jgi:hypothetical protein